LTTLSTHFTSAQKGATGVPSVTSFGTAWHKYVNPSLALASDQKRGTLLAMDLEAKL